jgi:hypothetical protein
VDVGRKLTINTDAVKFNQIQKPANLNRFGNPSATQKRILQISTDLEMVRESNIKKN